MGRKSKAAISCLYDESLLYASLSLSNYDSVNDDDVGGRKVTLDLREKSDSASATIQIDFLRKSRLLKSLLSIAHGQILIFKLLSLILATRELKQ